MFTLDQFQDSARALLKVKHLDTAADLVQILPGGTLASNTELWFSGPSQAPLRDCGHRFEQERAAIAELVAKRHPHKEAARMLDCAHATVRNHVQSACGKLGVGNIAGLIRELQLAD